VASKSAQDNALSSEDIEELLDAMDKNLDRIKTLYEQYFLGIQKQPPTFLHTDIERKLRDLTQANIRNTGLRYRFATLQQKFGAYNSYWKRTLRQIENGTYIRNLSKIGREAIRTGAEIPEEILAAMPKRMREQVVRDREQAISIAKRRKQAEEDLLTLAPEGEPQPPEAGEVAAMIAEPSFVRKELKTRSGAHVIDDDDEFDLNSFFADVERNEAHDTPVDRAPVAAARPFPRPDTESTTVGPPPAPAPRAATSPGIAAATMPTGPMPRAPTGPVRMPTGPVRMPTGPLPRLAPSQQSRPNPIAPGAAAAKGDTSVESMNGPFPRQSGAMPLVPAPPPQRQTGPIPQIPPVRPTGPIPQVPAPPQRQTGPLPQVPPRQPTQPVRGAAPVPPVGHVPKPTPAPAPAKPPPGMTDADVNALYQKYVQAKQLIGEATGPREREKLLKTINAQAPKIMEQYKAKAVDFSVVVKDNQVIIRAKPKT
jgi:hypothetical protein